MPLYTLICQMHDITKLAYMVFILLVVVCKFFFPTGQMGSDWSTCGLNVAGGPDLACRAGAVGSDWATQTGVRAAQPQSSWGNGGEVVVWPIPDLAMQGEGTVTLPDLVAWGEDEWPCHNPPGLGLGIWLCRRCGHINYHCFPTAKFPNPWEALWAGCYGSMGQIWPMG